MRSFIEKEAAFRNRERKIHFSVVNEQRVVIIVETLIDSF